MLSVYPVSGLKVTKDNLVLADLKKSVTHGQNIFSLEQLYHRYFYIIFTKKELNLFLIWSQMMQLTTKSIYRACYFIYFLLSIFIHDAVSGYL
jgi:hypothetical protein